MDPNVVQISSTFPLAPMLYINNYSNENVRAGLTPPPPPIIKGNYTCFGKVIDPNDVLIRPLDSQGIERLYAHNDYKRELKKINHSILMNYLDLLEILVKAPTAMGVNGRTLREEKLDELQLLFVNMHHLINELRPYQARDNLKEILEKQKEQRVEIANKFHRHLVKIVEVLKVCIGHVKTCDGELMQTVDQLNAVALRVVPTSPVEEDSVSASVVPSLEFADADKQPNEVNYECNDKILCEMIDKYMRGKNEV